MLGDPFACRELLEQRLVEPSRRAVVDVLDGRLAVAQLGAAQPDLKAPGVAIGRLAIEQQRQPFGMWRARAGLGSVLQLDEGIGHAIEIQRPASWSRAAWVSIVFSSMEVTGATDVGVCNRRPVRGRCGPFGFEVVLQDRIDGSEGARADSSARLQAASSRSRP